MPIDELLDGPRPADPALDRVWLDEHRRVQALLASRPAFDPRRALTLAGVAFEAWQVERRQWLQSRIADDRRQ